jgi:MarR family 2-MHQ and catechol resistance regulon transcriptional repressor
MAGKYSGTEDEERALDLFIKLIRAAAAVETRTSRLVAETGLTTNQFGALETLYHLGPMLAGQLATKHLKSPNNFTTVLSKLEDQGLITRERQDEDRRAVLVRLTPLGRERVESIMPGYVRAITADLGVLTAREQQRLAELLRKLGTNTP